jgi:hypothetical protein
VTRYYAAGLGSPPGETFHTPNLDGAGSRAGGMTLSHETDRVAESRAGNIAASNGINAEVSPDPGSLSGWTNSRSLARVLTRSPENAGTSLRREATFLLAVVSFSGLDAEAAVAPPTINQRIQSCRGDAKRMVSIMPGSRRS